MTANDSQSCLGYLNKLGDEYNNSHQPFIGKKSIHANCSALPEKTELSIKTPEFKVVNRIRITKYKTIFSKGYIGNWSKEIFVIDSVLKAYPLTHKIKDLNRKGNRKLSLKRVAFD